MRVSSASPFAPRWLLWLAALGLAAASTGCTRASAAGPIDTPPDGEVWVAEKQLGELSLEPAKTMVLPKVLSATGRIGFDEGRVARILSPISGRVTGVRAELGQRVKKGDVLAIIQSPEVSSATSDLAKAAADLVAAEHDLKRKRDLFAQNAGSKAEVELAEDTFHRAKAERDRAQQRSQLLQAGGGIDSVSSSFALKSPLDGEVISKDLVQNAEVQGQYSGGNPQPLYVVGNVDQVWLNIDVFERDMAAVHTGMTVGVRSVAFPARTFEGTVDWVASAMDPKARTVRLRCVLPNPDRLLKPEMFVTADLRLAEEPTLIVPAASVLRLGDHEVVFVQRGKRPDARLRFERITVETSEVSGHPEWTRITKGLAAGDVVVSRGAVLLLGTI